MLHSGLEVTARLLTGRFGSADVRGEQAQQHTLFMLV